MWLNYTILIFKKFGSWLPFIVIIVAIIFMIYKIFKNKKKAPKEEKKKKETITILIKEFLRVNYKIKNRKIEFENVKIRTGKHYRYKDIFDVTIKVLGQKKLDKIKFFAFEIESISEKIDKKTEKVSWNINYELDYKNTIDRLNYIKNNKKFLSKFKNKKSKPIPIKIKIKNKNSFNKLLEKNKTKFVGLNEEDN